MGEKINGRPRKAIKSKLTEAVRFFLTPPEMRRLRALAGQTSPNDKARELFRTALDQADVT